MKKYGILLTGLMLAYGIFGCGQEAVDITVGLDGYGKATLANGITLLVNVDKSTSLSAGRILIGGGVLTEDEVDNGITNLTVKMLLKGNNTMTAEQISQELDFLGATVSTDCFKDYSAISFVSLTENFPKVVDIIARSLMNPSFPEEELEKLKTEVEGDLKSEEDNQTGASNKLFWTTAFGDKSYGLPNYGTMETLPRIAIEDIREYYNDYVGGRNLIISVATDMDAKELASLMTKSFGQLKADAELAPAPALELQGETTGFKEYDRNQSFVFTGIILEHPTLKQACYISLLDEVMGKNVGSRLWFLRQKEKLAYAVYTQDIFNKYCASFRAAIGTDTSKVKLALSSLDREWNKMAAEGITEAEFADARVNLKNNLIYQIDKKNNRANNMATYEYIGYGQKFVPEMIALVDEVTVEEMNEYIMGTMGAATRYTSIVGKK